MATQKNTRSRKYQIRNRNTEDAYETDGTYLLKLITCTLLGMLWLKFSQPVMWLGIPMSGLPIGLFVGLIVVSQLEHYQTDRKIWYAILVIVTIISYFAPAGVLI